MRRMGELVLTLLTGAALFVAYALLRDNKHREQERSRPASTVYGAY
jgi:hypothetical protein